MMLVIVWNNAHDSTYFHDKRNQSEVRGEKNNTLFVHDAGQDLSEKTRIFTKRLFCKRGQYRYVHQLPRLDWTGLWIKLKLKV